MSNTKHRQLTQYIPHSRIGFRRAQNGSNFLQQYFDWQGLPSQHAVRIPENHIHLLLCLNHGLSLDPLALRLCYRRGKNVGMHLLRKGRAVRRRGELDRPPWHGMLRDP